MKIGIDARLYGVAGPGRYIKNLIKELEDLDTKNDYIIFVSKSGSNLYHPHNPRFKKWISDYKEYSIQEQTFFLRDLLQARLDLLHIPHFNIPILYPKKMVITIHDLIMHKSKTSEVTTLSAPKYLLKQFVYRFVTNIASFRASNIIVPSKSVGDDVVKMLKYANKDKTFVTYEGVDSELLALDNYDKKKSLMRLEEMRIVDNYFLYVGSAYPHKNLNMLLVSYKELLEKLNVRAQLVFAGRIDDFSQRLAGFSHALNLDGKVIYAARFSETPFVTETDLAMLYKSASVYVFPSLMEGFSITPLEAQAFGVPVLLSDIETHREVFGDSVVYFDPKSTIDLSENMKEIYNNEVLKQELIEKGYENVKKYSWKNMASETLKVYEGSV